MQKTPIAVGDRPEMRVLDMHPVSEGQHDGALLSDPEGLFSDPVFVPRGLFPVLARFDGVATCEEIAKALSAEFGQQVGGEDVRRIAQDLADRACLKTAAVDEALAERRREFAAMAVRPSRHAGSAGYPSAVDACRSRLDEILGRATVAEDPQSGPIRGLIAPHIDLQRGELGYAEAYAALRRDGAADLYVLFGTAHRGPSRVLVPTRKDFETPLGIVRSDADFVAAVEDVVYEADDPLRHRDERLHLDEHSLEFQVLFLRHVFGDRDFRIAPFLTGALPEDPDADAQLERVVETIVRECRRRGDQRIVFVGGADLAHEGPFFGDDPVVDDSRLASLAEEDRASLELLRSGRRAEFHADVERGGNPRRICGTTPCWFVDRLSREFGGERAELLHYGQALADDRTQVVTFASMAMRATVS